MAELQRQFEGAADPIDFSDGLGSEFGVEDTTIIGKNQLDSFLLGESNSSIEDVNNIQKVENEDKQPEQKQPQSQNQNKQQNQNDKSQAQKQENPEQDLEEASNSLNDWLLSDKDKEKNSKDKDTGEDQNLQNQNDKQPENNTDEENQFVTLSRDLYKLGVFTQEEDEEGNPIDPILADSPEAFLERFQAEKKRGAAEMVDNFLERFGEDYRSMFDSVFVKGVNPKDYLASYNKIESVKNLDLTNEVNQEKIFTQYYRDQGLSEDKIQKRLERSKDLGYLADEATEYQELLVQKEEQNQAKMEADRQQELAQKQAREAAYQQNVTKILQTKLQSGEFDGIPVSKKEAQETLYYMTNKPYRRQDTGELITEMQKDWLELDRPENHELKVKVALLLKNKMDLSKVQKKAVSNKTDSLFTSITNKKTAQNRKEGTVTAPKSFFS